MRPFFGVLVATLRDRRVAVTLSIACAWLGALASIAMATTYEVGPGKPFPTPSDVPWESISAGDSILIHARPAPYRDKWVICRVGTAAAPIVVRGIPDGAGTLPVIDGDDAVTRPALNFWNENRGVIKIGGANNPPDTMPAWIIIESLDIRGARPENTFTGRNGLTSYANNAASIYIEKGQNVVVRGCHLHDCSNGFFCASQTTNLLVEANWIDDNGNVGSIFEHNNYTEALGIVFQFNHFGPLRAGAGGNNLKDRSAGTIVRYNWIESGNRQLDLVESDFDELVDDPSYRETFVYGNILIEPDGAGNSQIAHYGGDGGDVTRYRHGTLYFHNNTLVSRRTGNTTLVRLSTDGDSADVRDNILFVTATGSRLALLDQDGYLVATQNWLKTGWVASHSGVAVDVINNGQVTGTAPGFVDLTTDNVELAPGSPCIDAAAALHPAVLPEHVPVREYVRHQMNRPRPNDGQLDIGAYEFATSVGVFPVAGAEPARGIRALRNPFSAECEIRAIDPRDPRLPSTIEVLDVSGRLVARCVEIERGRWIWRPDAGASPGLYVIRAGRHSARATLIR